MAMTDDIFRKFNDRRKKLGLETLGGTRSRDLDRFPYTDGLEDIDVEFYLSSVKQVICSMENLLRDQILEAENDNVVDVFQDVRSYRIAYFDDFDMTKRYNDVGEMLFDDFLEQTEEVLDYAAEIEDQLNDFGSSLIPEDVTGTQQSIYEEILQK